MEPKEFWMDSIANSTAIGKGQYKQMNRSYLPLLVLSCVHFVSLVAQDNLLYHTVRGILISQTGFGMIATDVVLIIACLYPVYKRFVAGKYLFLLLAIYILANLMLIFLMWLMALAMGIGFVNSTFGFSTVVGFIMLSILLSCCELTRREQVLMFASVFVADGLSTYLLMIQAH